MSRLIAYHSHAGNNEVLRDAPIGKVEVDHDRTACTTHDAARDIKRTRERGKGKAL